VADALELELDRLFRLPLAELVEARDALADRLRKAGDKVLATRVKSVRRATPAAWALNQLHFEQPELLERARDASDEVRALHAQEGVDPRALSAALSTQRAVLHELVEAALARCEEGGHAGGPALQRKLLATLQAVLAGASDEAFGRLTRDLAASGFDAIAAVGSVAQPAPGSARPPLAHKTLLKAEPAVEARGSAREQSVEARGSAREQSQHDACATARAALREQELRVHEAAKRVQQGRAELSGSRKEQASAEARVREAEMALSVLRDRLAQRTAESARLQTIVDEAIAREGEARAALDQARAALAALEAASP
jgi:hypothetical protein